MEELFRLKIAAKRQVTVPQRLLNLLHLEEGDEIRLEVTGDQITKVEACKVVPTHFFSPAVLKQIAMREAEPSHGRSINPQQLINTAEVAGEQVTSANYAGTADVGHGVQSEGGDRHAAKLEGTTDVADRAAPARAGKKITRGAF
jgi:bifunctional DNA-binding transcriptional regulator/antitoxin component of YhaV-PrlF toxin-antitoxin module